ncbi:MAG: hypothetical protein DRJ01_15995 [Bacteroidetes bacterium]|nr:MAG: hypothetical protein DRJ01_15995 [Bacteroidota bacterium]
MKRIILGISVLLMLGQNVFATTDAEFDNRIKNAKTLQIKQMHRCHKAAMNHMSTANVNVCLKSIEIQRKNGVPESDLGVYFANVGLLYDESKGDKLKELIKRYNKVFDMLQRYIDDSA